VTQAPSGRSRFMHVQMDVTTRCNLRCVMCAREQYPPANEDMPLASFTKIADQLFDKAAVLTLSCGAEPLMSPHFAEVLDIVGRYRVPRVEFVTNGTLLNERLIHKIIETNVTTVEVSIDGAEASTYERIRKGARFERVLQNLETLRLAKASRRTRRPHLKLNFVMMRGNIEELPSFVDMAARLGATEVAPQHLVVYEDAQMQEESLYGFQELADDMVLRARQVARHRGLIFRMPPLFRDQRSLPGRAWHRAQYAMDVFRHYGGARVAELGVKLARHWSGMGRTACTMPWEFVLLNPQGAVLPCNVWYDEPPMGNILEQSFADVWHGEPYRVLREELRGQRPLRQVCVHCPCVASCRVDRSAFETVPAPAAAGDGGG
jgi:radical SAM protein with 4Fe4S-binding SPASM domain